MTIEEVYNFILFVINKNQLGGLPPAQFNPSINVGQNQYLSFLLGSFQQYQYGRPQARVEYGQNAIIRERLSPFIGSPMALNLDSNGFGAEPADYLAFDAMMYGADDSRIKLIQTDRKASHKKSKINPPSISPFAIKVAGGFEVVPINTTGVKLSYIKKPAQLKYAYILDGNNRPVYDPGSSVQPQWSDVDMMEIISRTLGHLGVNLQAGAVQQYSQMIKTQGQ